MTGKYRSHDTNLCQLLLSIEIWVLHWIILSNRPHSYPRRVVAAIIPGQERTQAKFPSNSSRTTTNKNAIRKIVHVHEEVSWCTIDHTSHPVRTTKIQKLHGQRWINFNYKISSFLLNLSETRESLVCCSLTSSVFPDIGNRNTPMTANNLDIALIQLLFTGLEWHDWVLAPRIGANQE